ncbi:DUF1064 domain-containing protein [Novosphingobium sp.]|uniref:DUF1064 domain-containing protein n=1 Tax=Novosphingobium sp. TaxID=1874826 RepID=UPI00286EA7DE|nr:DUF1064 domain-containing protein [Novosphingobium sp.]
MSASNESIIAAYEQTGNVHKAAIIVGVAHSTVHRRLVKLGLNKSNPIFTDAELNQIRDEYCGYADIGKLDEFAELMGRHKTTLCSAARRLGLTDQSRKRPYFSESSSIRMRERIATRGHNRGALGLRHSDETKATISQKSRAMWAGMTADERSALTMSGMKTKVEKYGTLAPVRTRGSWKAGWREVGGRRCFFRSRWEANYARYLQLVKDKGLIEDWEHEPQTFWFEAIKRGVRSYLPDFRVTEMDGETTFHEVKGWMDQRSRTTISRFRKYYPEHRLIVIEKRDYEEIQFDVRREIPDWEPG